jgi:general stress protein 26
MSESNDRKHLYDLLKDFDSAMLVTSAEDGSLRSRPMAIAGCDPNAPLYFVTSVVSPKVKELERDPRVNIAMQGKTKYVSLSGVAHVVHDQTLIDRLWSEAWKVWFPKGKHDPAICLLAVEPHEAEYWDNAGAKGVRYLLQAVKAYANGTTPTTTEEQHAKVHL